MLQSPCENGASGGPRAIQSAGMLQSPCENGASGGPRAIQTPADTSNPRVNGNQNPCRAKDARDSPWRCRARPVRVRFDRCETPAGECFEFTRCTLYSCMPDMYSA